MTLRKYIWVFAVSFLIFLLWPRSFEHYTYKPPCPRVSVIDACELKKVSPKWRFGGGMDVICSTPDAFKYKRSGLKLTQVNSCFESRDETWGTSNGHYYIGKTFNISYPIVGSFLICGLIIGSYLRLRPKARITDVES